MQNNYITLKNRAVITISGENAQNFLQGLISNDINKVSQTQSIYALLLTPQGKFLFDFFIAQKDDKYYIDCWAEAKSDLIKRLKMYRLRSKVSISDVSDKYEVVALLGNGIFEDEKLAETTGLARQFCKGIAYIDPRTTKLFGRAFIKKENNYQSFICHNFTEGDEAEYNQFRIKSCVPDGEHDLEYEQSFPLQFNMNELNAIDFNKGCYIGQEVTTRSHHQGKLKKKIFLVKGNSSNLPAKNTSITLDDKKIGKLCSSMGSYGLALFDIDTAENKIKNSTFKCDDFVLELY